MTYQKIDKLDLFIDKAIKLINSNEGRSIIHKIYKHPLYNDEPKIFAYSAVYGQVNKHREDLASGFSFSKEIALARVLGESIERYCLDHYKPKKKLIAPKENLKIAYLNPLEVNSFSMSQLKKREFKRFKILKGSKFRWVEGLSFPEKKKILIPLQLISMDTDYLEEEPIIRLPISTGTAAGETIDSSIYRAICEVIERDSFMISYLNRINSPKIELEKINDKDIKNILKIFKRYKLQLVVVDITTELNVPAFAAIAIDKTGLGPSISLGLKAGFEIKDTIIGAIEESLMTRSWIRDKFIYLNPEYKENDQIISIEDRAHYWLAQNKIKNLDFWLKSKHKSKFNINYKQINNQLDELIKNLKLNKLDIVYVDITDQEIKKKGFSVIKVIIPKLQPLYLDERYPYLGGERLYRLPIEMGMIKNQKNEKDLNNIPHPFL